MIVTAGESTWPYTVSSAVQFERLGEAIATVGDFDGDGISDAIIGSSRSTGRKYNHGEVYLVLLLRDGSVKSVVALRESSPSQAPPQLAYEYFGSSVASVADLDNDFLPDSGGDFDADGVPDVAIGAYGADGVAKNTGAVYLMFLTSTGQPREYIKLANETGSATTISMQIPAGAKFGTSVAVRDVSNSVVRLAVGAPGVNDGAGAVYLLSVDLASPPQLLSIQTVNSPEESIDALFGASVAWMPDGNGDGEPELLIGAPGHKNTGSVYIIDSTKRELCTVCHAGGVLTSPQATGGASFGKSVALGPDWDGNGQREILVGAPGVNNGIIYTFYAGAPQWTSWAGTDLISPFGNKGFGESVATLGFLNDDAVPDVIVGTPQAGRDASSNGGFATVMPRTHTFPPPAPPSEPPLPIAPDTIGKKADTSALTGALDGGAVGGVFVWTILIIIAVSLFFIWLCWKFFRRTKVEITARRRARGNYPEMTSQASTGPPMLGAGGPSAGASIGSSSETSGHFEELAAI